MKRLAAFAGVLVGVLLSSGTAFALAYFGYEEWGGTWYDADKTPGRTDETYLCWAASAANVLAWGGWTTTAADTETKIYQEIKSSWSDQPGLEERAWRWWIDGTAPAGTQGEAHLTKAGGGNYFARDFDSLYRASYTADAAMSNVDAYLHAGYGVTLSIYPNTSSGGHSLTVWGYTYDSTGQYTGVWVTDSDDTYWIDRGLKFLSVAYDDIFHWWGLSDQTDHVYDRWHIGGVQGLYNNRGQGSGVPVAGGGSGGGRAVGSAAFAGTVPEPGTPALLAGGLLAAMLCRYGRRRGLGRPARR